MKIGLRASSLLLVLLIPALAEASSLVLCNNGKNLCQRLDDGTLEYLKVKSKTGEIVTIRNGEPVEVDTPTAKAVYAYYTRWLPKSGGYQTLLQTVLDHYGPALVQRGSGPRQGDGSSDERAPIRQRGDATYTDHRTGQDIASRRQDRRPMFTPDRAQDPYIDQCLKTRPKGRVLTKNRNLSDGVYGWTTINSWMMNDGEKITIKTALKLNYQVSSAREKGALVQRMERIKNCMEWFYRKHGINLELTFVHEQERSLPRGFLRNVINLWRYGRGYNVSNWGFTLGGYDLDDLKACSTMLHEFTHMFGVMDEYPDGNRPGQMIGEPDSIMRYTFTSPAKLRLYPRHIKTILGPLCGYR